MWLYYLYYIILPMIMKRSQIEHIHCYMITPIDHFQKWC